MPKSHSWHKFITWSGMFHSIKKLLCSLFLPEQSVYFSHFNSRFDHESPSDSRKCHSFPFGLHARLYFHLSISLVNISWTVSDVCVFWLLLSLNDLLPCAFSPNQDWFFLFEKASYLFLVIWVSFVFHNFDSICLWPLHSIPWCPGILTFVGLSLLESFPFYLLLDMAEYIYEVCSISQSQAEVVDNTNALPSEEQWWQRASSTNVVSAWILGATPYLSWVCCWF